MTETKVIVLSVDQLKLLADSKCPGCEGKVQESGFFPDTFMCADRNLKKTEICGMDFWSPEKAREGLNDH